ncbi:MAG: hypothetical protein ACTHKP_09675, partial [Nitrososphaeraceae archaeon]
ILIIIKITSTLLSIPNKPGYFVFWGKSCKPASLKIRLGNYREVSGASAVRKLRTLVSVHTGLTKQKLAFMEENM